MPFDHKTAAETKRCSRLQDSLAERQPFFHTTHYSLSERRWKPHNSLTNILAPNTISLLLAEGNWALQICLRFHLKTHCWQRSSQVSQVQIGLIISVHPQRILVMRRGRRRKMQVSASYMPTEQLLPLLLVASLPPLVPCSQTHEEWKTYLMTNEWEGDQLKTSPVSLPILTKTKRCGRNATWNCSS